MICILLKHLHTFRHNFSQGCEKIEGKKKKKNARKLVIIVIYLKKLSTVNLERVPIDLCSLDLVYVTIETFIYFLNFICCLARSKVIRGC